ncbi:BZ3500_MvSof-1268-A1-R1_Chr1-3g02476 [Microbotryum saponariae]|uniref:BZ3500_MvSof-1268-A1-R1_Chr1-3g02476 protein n=1 Tax=Microbotryum saponariae TaxID=289078 RepID=A0A2X0L5N3_9BASI|nr:BZ3500_MvSof-1268-A1-R1_Chr1-3g02476 [Microbotryum saponariae]SCZ96340.1 BZ3501_MvSof-1269-A2-R1_Chr1-3g02079 [Microbotryum saponariae]
MTSLDPSHFPSSSSSHDDARLRGQAVHQSVSVSVEPEISSSYHPHHQQQRNSSGYVAAASSSSSSSEPSWKGAWARRQALKKAQQLERERNFQNDGDVDQTTKESFDRSSFLEKVGFSNEEKRKVRDHHHHQRIQVPPIPDLRYEQGILMSIRPFLHRLQPTTSTTVIASNEETILGDENINPLPSHQERHEERKEVEEKTAMVSSALTAEAARDGLKQGEQTDLLAGPLRFEWGKIVYVIFRDQFIYPLLQGLVWGVGGLWIASLWDWNKSRLDASAGAAGATKGTAKKGVSPVSNWLARFGLKARS